MFKFPAYAQLEVTDKCNLRCRHCYHFDTKQMPVSKDLSDEDTTTLINSLVAAGIYSLVITGGEPLVRPQLTLKAVDIAKSAGMSVSVNSNLLLLNSQLAEKFKDSKVNSFLVSCPASDSEMYQRVTRCGNYDRFKSKLEILLNTNISCMVNMVVTKLNCHLVRDTATEMARLGVKRFAATPASLNVEHPDFESLLDKSQTIIMLEDLKWCDEYLGLSVDSLEPLPKCFYPEWCWQKKYAFMERSCQAGRMSISVSNTGDVRPCSHNPMVYGNMFSERLDTIWEKMSPCRNKTTPDSCTQCPSVLMCNGSCRTNALAIAGEITKPDRFFVGHMASPEILYTNKIIKNDSLIVFNGKIYFRKEMGENHSIATKRGGRNLMIVNEELFNFINWLEGKLPLTFTDLKKCCQVDDSNKSFMSIMSTLLRREFIKISNQ